MQSMLCHLNQPVEQIVERLAGKNEGVTYSAIGMCLKESLVCESADNRMS